MLELKSPAVRCGACAFVALAAAVLAAPAPALAQSCAVPGAYLDSAPFRAWRAIRIGDTLVIYRPGDLASPLTGACSDNCRVAGDHRSVTTLTGAQASGYLSAAGAAWAASQGFARITLVTCTDNDDNDDDADRDKPSPPPPPPPDDDDDDDDVEVELE